MLSSHCLCVYLLVSSFNFEDFFEIFGFLLITLQNCMITAVKFLGDKKVRILTEGHIWDDLNFFI